MAKVLVNETSLTGIADAIRTKNGTEEKYKPAEMAAAVLAIQSGSEPIIEGLAITANGTYRAPDGIDGFSPITVNVPQEGAPTEEELTFKGNLQYFDYGGVWDWFLNKYKNQIKIEEVTYLESAFTASQMENLDLVISCQTGRTSSVSFRQCFSSCAKLKTPPKFKNFPLGDMGNLFSACYALREIPEDFIQNCTWASESASQGFNGAFNSCYSLRKAPQSIIALHYNPQKNLNYSYSLYGSFSACCSLDEIVDLPNYSTVTSIWTSNGLSNTGYNNARLKKLTFKTNEDGTCPSVKWVNQKIDFSRNCGWATTAQRLYILSYNSGITADKEVKDDATYQSLKNDADWFTLDVNYSRYNHDSAVETINTIPDTSAYLTEKGSGTNTINFKGEAGSKTDGGAINTLTVEEIAVATAKGWTISLT